MYPQTLPQDGSRAHHQPQQVCTQHNGHDDLPLTANWVYWKRRQLADCSCPTSKMNWHDHTTHNHLWFPITLCSFYSLCVCVRCSRVVVVKHQRIREDFLSHPEMWRTKTALPTRNVSFFVHSVRSGNKLYYYSTLEQHCPTKSGWRWCSVLTFRSQLVTVSYLWVCESQSMMIPWNADTTLLSTAIPVIIDNCH